MGSPQPVNKNPWVKYEIHTQLELIIDAIYLFGFDPFRWDFEVVIARISIVTILDSASI